MICFISFHLLVRSFKKRKKKLVNFLDHRLLDTTQNTANCYFTIVTQMLWKFPKTMSNFSDLPSNKKIQYNYLFIFFWE